MKAMSLSISIDPASSEPVFRQLASQLKMAIESLSLRPGELLPSTRELCESLALSRTTVVRCYEELLSQGYLEAVDGVGTFVSQRIPSLPQHWTASVQTPFSISSYARQLLAKNPRKLFAHDWPELNFGCAPAGELPIKKWRQLLLEHSRNLGASSLDYNQEPFGYLPLRKALCKYLARSRSVRCTADQIIVFPSSLYALHLVSQMLIDRDDLVAMSAPGFPYARHTFVEAGARLAAIPVDVSGLDISHLEKLETAPRMIYLNPSHHQPWGYMLSIQRRQEILDYAARNGTLLIEDDLDCNYRYSGRTAPCLQGLSDRQNTIYAGSFWQTLYPLVNVGYLVIPENLAGLFTHAWHLLYHTFHTQIPLLDQLALTDLIEGGFLERHIRKTEKVYARRMQALVRAITANLGRVVKVYSEPSGMHLTVRFDKNLSDLELRECALGSNFPLVSTAAHYAEEPLEREFIVPFAHLEEEEIDIRVSGFSELLEGR